MKRIFLFFVILLLAGKAFAQYGSLDSTFNFDGIAMFDDTSGFGSINDMGLQSDGKIILGGRSDLNDFVFYRFTTAGLLDSTFGTNGRTVVDIFYQDFMTDLKVQDDDKIIACGYTDHAAIVRLNADGSLDTSYDNDGIALYGMDNVEFWSLALDGDNIIAAGRIEVDEFNTDYFIVRLLPDGTPDTSFYYHTASTSEYDWLFDIIVLPDHKVIAAGISYNVGSDQRFVVLRYLENGLVDSSFGSNGTSFADFPQYYSEQSPAIVLDADGKIILTGYVMGNNTDMAFARLNANGSVDSSFGVNGQFTLDIYGYTDRAWGVAMQPDGKILFTGGSWNTLSQKGVVLIRCLADGTLDSGFADNGISYHVLGDNSSGHDVMLQPDGKILVGGGGTLTGGDLNVVCLRYQNDFATGISHSGTSQRNQILIYPNPLSESGVLEFSLDRSSPVEINLMDLKGGIIKTVLKGYFEAGVHHDELFFDYLPKGIYLVEFSFAAQRQYLKLISQ